MGEMGVGEMRVGDCDDVSHDGKFMEHCMAGSQVGGSQGGRKGALFIAIQTVLCSHCATHVQFVCNTNDSS